MTNQEAIEFLSQIMDMLLASNSWLPSTDNPIKESFGMAINALTAQPETHDKRTEMHSCDWVSRQAAISLPVKPKEDRYFQTQNLDDAYDYGWSDLQGCIEKMPSAQSQRKKGKWIDNETSYADGVRQTCTCSICGQRSVRPLGRFCR